MERTAALALAARIETQWFDRLPIAKLDVWIDNLLTLDEGAAGTAFVRLRSSDKTTITPQEFASETRRLHTTDASTRPTPCIHCDNTGWIDAPDRIHNPGTDHERRTTQVQPCHCTEGQARAASRIWTSRQETR